MGGGMLNPIDNEKLTTEDVGNTVEYAQFTAWNYIATLRSQTFALQLIFTLW